MIGILRSNENELKKEIQRVRDVMQTQTPGTPEYGLTEAQYNNLLDREQKLKENKTSRLKIFVSAAGGIGGVLLYRKLIDTSADPFFRDFGKQLLGCIKHV